MTLTLPAQTPLSSGSDFNSSSARLSRGASRVSEPQLPGYTRTASSSSEREQLHTFDAKSSGGKLILTVTGNPALSRHTPTFVQGEPVEGIVELNISSADRIRSVSVSVRGRITTGRGSRDDYTFLDQALMLWSDGGKLQGNNSWPFSIDIPAEVLLPTRGEPKLYALPQSFVERHTQARICYDIVVHVARGKFRTDSKITAPFTYIPATRPPLPSPLRQLAYQQGLGTLVSPEADPDGWHTLEPVEIRGTMRGQRSVDVRCTLSLAKPLCYTRGSFLPCTLTVASSDDEALEILSSPRSIVLRVRRAVKFHEIDRVETETEAVDHTESATWWPSRDDLGTGQRRLNGEVSLKNTLKPSAHLAHFKIEYAVVLFPFDVPEFTHTSRNSAEPLLTLPIEITTAFADDGLQPHSMAPPPYIPRSG